MDAVQRDTGVAQTPPTSYYSGFAPQEEYSGRRHAKKVDRVVDVAAMVFQVTRWAHQDSANLLLLWHAVKHLLP